METTTTMIGSSNGGDYEGRKKRRTTGGDDDDNYDVFVELPPRPTSLPPARSHRPAKSASRVGGVGCGRGRGPRSDRDGKGAVIGGAGGAGRRRGVTEATDADRGMHHGGRSTVLGISGGFGRRKNSNGGGGGGGGGGGPSSSTSSSGEFDPGSKGVTFGPEIRLRLLSACGSGETVVPTHPGSKGVTFGRDRNEVARNEPQRRVLPPPRLVRRVGHPRHRHDRTGVLVRLSIRRGRGQSFRYGI